MVSEPVKGSQNCIKKLFIRRVLSQKPILHLKKDPGSGNTLNFLTTLHCYKLPAKSNILNCQHCEESVAKHWRGGWRIYVDKKGDILFFFCQHRSKCLRLYFKKYIENLFLYHVIRY